MSSHRNKLSATIVPTSLVGVVRESLDSLGDKPKMTPAQLIEAILNAPAVPRHTTVEQAEAALGVLADSGVDVHKYLVEERSGRHLAGAMA
jgi:hypothetical protein